MAQFNPDKWEITDDDELLSLKTSEILTQEKIMFEQTSIYLREDLIQMVHKESNIILDLGYYGENIWRVYTIDKVAGWENPIEDKIFNSLVNSIIYIKELAIKYS